MKILFFIGSLQSGGAERVAVRLTDAFTEELKWDTTLVTGDFISNDFYRCRSARRYSLEFDYEKSNLRSEQFNRVRKVRNYIKKEGPDLLVFSSIDFSLRGLFSTLGLKVPKIICEHNNYFAVTNVKKRLIRNTLYPMADRVFLLTSRDIDNYPGNVRKKVRVVPNPLGVEGEYVQRTFQKKLLAVGRLTEQKAFHRMLSVVSQLPEEYSLQIVGEGPLEEELKKLCKEMKLDSRVSFEGRSDNVPDYYRAASLLLMTSLFEGLPMVIAEANAHALPVISYDCETGPREMIRDSESGFVVADDNSQQMVEKILTLERDPELYKTMCDNAYEQSKQFSIENTLLNWKKEIGELVNL